MRQTIAIPWQHCTYKYHVVSKIHGMHLIFTTDKKWWCSLYSVCFVMLSWIWKWIATNAHHSVAMRRVQSYRSKSHSTFKVCWLTQFIHCINGHHRMTMNGIQESFNARVTCLLCVMTCCKDSFGLIFIRPALLLF